MKLYDFDGMFDKKLGDYIAKNSSRYSEEEWEDIIPELYKSFGDSYIRSVRDTPNGFYANLTDEELVRALRAHLKQGVAVSRFLSNAVERRGAVKLLLPLLDGAECERDYAVNLIGSDERALKKYMQFLVSPEINADFKERCAELLKEKADLVADEAVAYYERGVEREYMLEIMSRSVIRDDRIFEILLKEFRGDPENVPMHAAYLAAYGDERALKYLTDKIDEEGISFLEYKELLLAIEALGGEYARERDFSDDPYFGLIKNGEENAADIFGSVDKAN